MNPLATQLNIGRDIDSREDFIEDEDMESPNIRFEDDNRGVGPGHNQVDLDDEDEEEMADIGNEDVRLMGVPNNYNQFGSLPP